MKGARILIIADIEGSSGCLSRDNARFLGSGWDRACEEMTRDVDAVVTALFDAGAGRVHVQDFHRTGYNILPRHLHPGAALSRGYRTGPVPGMGTVGNFHGVILMGMHAPSGVPGFLSHTLTSRIAGIRVNGQLVSEAQLFSAALAPIPPLLFSGCPAACRHTCSAIPGLRCVPIDKQAPGFSPDEWRSELSAACVRAASRNDARPYRPRGPFEARIEMRDRAEARAVERRWKVERKGNALIIIVRDFAELFREASRLVYLTPLKEKLLPVGLPLYHLAGRAGLAWARMFHKN